MSQIEKLIEAIKNNPKNVDWEEIDKVLRFYGFQRGQPSSGSSHYTYRHPRLPEIITIPKNRPVKAVYVKNAIKLIERLEEMANEEGS